MFKFLGKLFDSNQKEINRLTSIVSQIGAEEEKVSKLKSGQFKEETAKLKSRLSGGETLDDLSVKGIMTFR